jgi:hypothetical protein
MANGYLLQVIADTSSTPGAPTASSFTGTDSNEVVVTSTAMNYVASPGDAAINVSFTLGTTGTPTGTGSYLFLRWYPTLTSSATSPGNGTSYGQFSSLSDEYPSNTSSIDWQIPAFGNYDMYFLTQSQDSLGPGTANNPPPNSAGVANLVVGAVPEPASISLIAGAIGLGAIAVRRRRR